MQIALVTFGSVFKWKEFGRRCESRLDATWYHELHLCLGEIPALGKKWLNQGQTFHLKLFSSLLFTLSKSWCHKRNTNWIFIGLLSSNFSWIIPIWSDRKMIITRSDSLNTGRSRGCKQRERKRSTLLSIWHFEGWLQQKKPFLFFRAAVK